METEKSDIYGMVGFCLEDRTPSQANFFGGFFSVRTNPNKPQTEILPRPLNGYLIDCYGSSRIFGEIGPLGLEFERRYENREDKIKYTFRGFPGVWIGKYSINEKTVGGNILLRTNIFWGDMEMFANGFSFYSEREAEDLIKSMLKKKLARKN